MDLNRKTVATLAMVAVLVVSAGSALAAAPTVDTETTDTATTTELQTGDTITYNTSTNSVLSFSADSTNGSVVVFQGDRQLVEYTNDSDLVTKSGSGTSVTYFNATFADDGADFDGLRADPGETVDLTLSMVNDSALDYSAADKTNITVSFSNAANITFADFTSDDTEISEPSFFARTTASLPVIGDGSDNLTDPAQADRTVNVTGADQEQIVVNIADSDAQSALDESLTDVTGVSYTAYGQLGDRFVPVVSSASDAPDWIGDDQPYVSLSEDGGQATVWNAGALLDDGQEEVDLSITGAEQLNVFEVRSLLSEYGASTFTVLTESLANGELFGAASDQFEG